MILDIRHTWTANTKHLAVWYRGNYFVFEFNLLHHSFVYWVCQTFERVKHTTVTHEEKSVKTKSSKGKLQRERLGAQKTNPQKWLLRIETWSQVLTFLLSKWSVMVNAVMVQSYLLRHWSQSTSISFVPGFACWLPFASPFPSVPWLVDGPLWAPLFWSLTSGLSSTVGFGLLITGLHTSSSSWWVKNVVRFL